LNGLAVELQSWSDVHVETGNCSFSSPTIAPDGTVFIGSNDRKLYAVSADGHIRMTLPTGGGVASSPTLGALYVGTDHRTVVVVAPSGQVVRELLTESPVRGAVAATPAVSTWTPKTSWASFWPAGEEARWTSWKACGSEHAEADGLDLARHGHHTYDHDHVVA
jgi:hypothetical protein